MKYFCCGYFWSIQVVWDQSFITSQGGQWFWRGGGTIFSGKKHEGGTMFSGKKHEGGQIL